MLSEWWHFVDATQVVHQTPAHPIQSPCIMAQHAQTMFAREENAHFGVAMLKDDTHRRWWSFGPHYVYRSLPSVPCSPFLPLPAPLYRVDVLVRIVDGPMDVGVFVSRDMFDELFFVVEKAVPRPAK